jgi:hypothetical protein
MTCDVCGLYTIATAQRPSLLPRGSWRLRFGTRLAAGNDLKGNIRAFVDTNLKGFHTCIKDSGLGLALLQNNSTWPFRSASVHSKLKVDPLCQMTSPKLSKSV